MLLLQGARGCIGIVLCLWVWKGSIGCPGKMRRGDGEGRTAYISKFPVFEEQEVLPL